MDETSPAVWDGARMFSQIAQDLAGQHGYACTGDRVLQLATLLIECDTAAIWSMNSGHAKVHATTDPTVRLLEPVVNHEKDGLAWSCLHRKATLRIDDVRTDGRWPVYQRWLERHDQPMLSAIGYSLEVDDQIIGALVLWSRQVAHFTDRRVDIGAIFADHAAVSLELAAVEDRAQHLENALQSNRRIGMAIGILMSEYRVTDQTGFDMLRVVSQRQHRKLHDVAEDVILTGALADYPVRRPA